MTGTEYLTKKRQLAQFEALEKSMAFGEVLAQIKAEHRNCIQGLRNRQIPVAERQEFLEGADLTERLVGYVPARIARLRAETELTPEEVRALGVESRE